MCFTRPNRARSTSEPLSPGTCRMAAKPTRNRKAMTTWYSGIRMVLRRTALALRAAYTEVRLNGYR
ncbi:hypothetical protein D3C78_1944000 [compost metagenome]